MKLTADYNLQAVSPTLAKEWHPIKNGLLGPKDFLPGSRKKVWWVCENGHEWEAKISNRTHGSGCPYCCGKAVCKDNCLQTLNPTLAKEWHDAKNGNLTPSDVTPNSNKRVWWKCEKGHEWEATVCSRNSGSKCPYCSGRLADAANCLLILNPILAKQWHPSKNGGLTPKDVTTNFSKKVWWLCEKGHAWQARVSERNNRGRGCPYCSGRRACKDNCLQTINPVLAKEWHPIKNGNLKPKHVTPNSNKRVWWKCKKGHEWQNRIADRNSGRGCPYCSGRAVCEDNCLQTLNPPLAKQWHPSKNKDITPRDITSGSGRKFWWLCRKGHEWQATVQSRNAGIGCPYCAGQAVCKDNCLQTINPVLSKEWHPAKNNKLTAKDVTPHSDNRVWWICEKGHEWVARVADRSAGIGCPYCAGKAVCEDNCLQTINPVLSKEWHPAKNNKLTAKDVTPHSGNKVWWICEKGHEWVARVAARSAGSGCPYCAGKAVCEDNCLQTINPALSKEWHPTKNGELTPREVTAGSKTKVWWVRKKGHVWRAEVYSRNAGYGCPYCSGKRVCEDNCLQTVNPNLAEEWHPTKNCNLTPRDVTTGSKLKVWWRCKRGHEWQATVGSRTRGRGCPFCKSQTSRLELRIYTEIKELFGKARHRTKLVGMECDVYIPSLKIGIELDSTHWHREKYRQDKNKTRVFSRKGIFLLRVREKGLERISKSDVFYSSTDRDIIILKRILKVILKQTNLIKEIRRKQIQKYIRSGEFVNHKEYLELLYRLPSPTPGYSLIDQDGQLAKEWHPTKNGSLTPKDVSPGSHQRIWWICVKGHEWRATVKNRSNGNGCPYCAGKLACKENCLNTLNPVLSKEWHPTKNGRLTPAEVTAGSNKKVWWKCKKGHEWLDTVIGRNNRGRGCPYCSSRLACEDNCLQTINPILAKEWHPSKNGGLSPRDVTASLNRKVWWKCKRGHEWQSSIASRHSRNSGCPYCAGKFVCKDNCLKTINPRLAKEWHPTKNGNLTPENVTAGSGKRVWWLCKKGHEWLDTVTSRNSRGRGCPYCSGKAVCQDNCLQSINPALAKEWHPTKNGNLTPKDVTAGSNKKVWWKCKVGHVWKTTITSRNVGRGCPYCSGKFVCKDNCLQSLNPSLSREWHPTRNAPLTPQKVTTRSSKKVWWLCKRGHSWQATIASRNAGAGCPYCSGRLPCEENCLQTIRPELAKEWHPTKNGKLTPRNVTYGSGKIVWWRCMEGHEWRVKVVNRYNGSNCPICRIARKRRKTLKNKESK